MKVHIAFAMLIGLKTLMGETIEARLAALEARVEALEVKKGETKVNDSNEEIAANDEGEDAVPVANPSGKQKVQLIKGAVLNAYLVTKNNYASVKKGEPLEKMIDESGVFQVGNILSKQVAKGFEKQHLGARWNGYLWIEKPGVHVFSSSWGARAIGVAQLYVNNQLVADVKSTDDAPQIGQLNFSAQGMYEVEIWVAPPYANQSSQKAQCDFEIREPGSDEFKMITPGILYSQK